MNQRKMIAFYFLLLFAIAVFVILFRRIFSADFLITFGAVSAALVVSLALNITTLKRFRNDPAASIPVIGFGMAYLLLVIFISLIFGWIFSVSSTVYLVIHILLSISAIIIAFGLYRGKNYIMNHRGYYNNKTMLDEFCMQTLLMKEKSSRMSVSVQREAIQILDHLYELFRYAEPGENQLSKIADEEISEKMRMLDKEIDNIINIHGDSIDGMSEYCQQIKEIMVRRKR